jgi:hypothetical protein
MSIRSILITTMATCKHNQTAPTHTMTNLHESQKPRTGRHKCAVCAYEAGYQYGLNNSIAPGGESECPDSGLRAPTEDLPISQEGEGVQRHKCCVCAYHAGYQAARAAAHQTAG